MFLKSIIKDEKGLSLIEVAMVLLIAGILTVPMVDLYTIYKETEKTEVTKNNITDVRNAVNKFAVKEGRYPIPASVSAVQGDVGFGHEGSPNPPNCASATWATTDGICRTATSPDVLIGAVPFNTVGLEEEESIDYWGNRILYAVSLTQTSAGTYVENDGVTGGAITVMEMSSAGLVAAPEFRDAIFVSHGPEAVGAYTAQGNAAAPCNVPVVEAEDENCDLDEVFVLEENARGYVKGGDYYDDYTSALKSPGGTAWSQPAMATDIAWTGATRIGIGTTNPSVKLEAAGDITATGKVRADQLCGPGSTCFDPEMITGALTEMDCAKKSALGGVVTGLGAGIVSCSGAVDASGNPASSGVVEYRFDATYIQQKDCTTVGSGQPMIGIDATGEPICAP